MRFGIEYVRAVAFAAAWFARNAPYVGDDEQCATLGIAAAATGDAEDTDHLRAVLALHRKGDL